MDIKELKVVNENKQNHPWEYARCALIKDILKKHIKVADGSVVLDVGSGDVFFLTQFSNEYPNLDLIAVDTAYDDDLISFLSGKYKNTIRFFAHLDDVTTQHNTTQHNTTQHNTVSIVFLLDVIEHIEHDVAFLEHLSQQPFIQPDTIFFITVPAYQFLYCKHDQWLGHERRYSQKLLKEHVEKSGLSYVSGGYFFTSLLLPRLIQKIIEKLKKEANSENVTGIGDWKGGNLVSNIYEKILLTDYYLSKFLRLFGIKIPGLSTYAICKKLNNKQI